MISLLGLLATLGFSIVYAVSIYNALIKKRAMAEESFSGVDVQLKRRADLIPNLVETVKGYMTHESGTLEKVTAMRARAQNASSSDERFQAESQISSLLGNIMAVSENYPDLKASTNFTNLQNELSELEEQIQLSRRYYNGTARDLNIMIDQFPTNIIAGFGGFQKKDYFEIENASDREVQKVSF
ncbi:MAG TPA: LemA family protein [Alphaproteobacteria bacterium]|nr:LemA family protein [Alphaproteobacteria bacterium]HOO50348.1 LemA family protein [Alphaproteobacteria bacterium]